MREAVAPPISRSANKSQHQLALTLVLVAAAALLATLAGAFGTLSLPVGARLFIFGSVISLNAIKWALWLRVLPAATSPVGRLLPEVAGALLLNLLLPLELELAFLALGYAVDLPFLEIYGVAVLISLVVGATIGGAKAALARAQPAIGIPAPMLPPFLRRAGVADAGALLAVEAEDHYVRLHLADGRKPLLLHGFGATLAELEPLGGLKVHRGAWVADGAVARASREGRKWRLHLRDGTIIAVSDSHRRSVRARGWLEAA